MQINNLNNLVNFKGYSSNMDNNSSFNNNDDFDNIVRVTQEFDEYCKNKKQPEKKNFLLSALSIGVGFYASYKLGKMGAKKINGFIANSKVASGITKFVGDFTKTTIDKMASSKNKTASKSAELVQKVAGKIKNKHIEETAGITAGILSTASLVKTDSNNDGVADILQKNVNAYTGALKDMQVLSNVIEVLA